MSVNHAKQLVLLLECLVVYAYDVKNRKVIFTANTSRNVNCWLYLRKRRLSEKCFNRPGSPLTSVITNLLLNLTFLAVISV